MQCSALPRCGMHVGDGVMGGSAWCTVVSVCVRHRFSFFLHYKRLGKNSPVLSSEPESRN